MKRTADVVWKGSGKNGKGYLTTQSGALKEQPYSFAFRFENEDGKAGTNPEELIGAAHAGCFNMALAVELEKIDVVADELQTRATVNLSVNEDGAKIDKIHLDLEAKIKGIEKVKFQEIAEAAKNNCPVSGLLKKGADITLKARLNSA